MNRALLRGGQRLSSSRVVVGSAAPAATKSSPAAAAGVLTGMSQLKLPPQQQQLRCYTLGGLGGGGGSGSSMVWPISKSNTVFNIVPQGHKYVVERFGKLHSIQDSGWFLAIPFVDQIAYVIDVRERAMDIPPQAAITRDNVSVEVSGNLFVKFQDAQNAAYGALNPLYSVTQVGSCLMHILHTLYDFHEKEIVVCLKFLCLV